MSSPRGNAIRLAASRLFGGDTARAARWFNAPHALLDGESPATLLRENKIAKLRTLIFRDVKRRKAARQTPTPRP